MTEKREGHFQGKGGLRLYYQSYLPVGKPSAVVVIVHGAGDHCERYRRAVKMLVPRGFAIYGFDQRGCGQSAGQRGHIDDWKEYREDVHAFIDLVAREQPGETIYLWGYSNGALVAADYALHHPAKLGGVILMSSPFKPCGKTSPVAVLAKRALSKAWPRFSLRRGPRIQQVTRDPQVIAAAAGDVQMHGLASARWGDEVRSALKRVGERSGELCLPLLILHGEDDQLYTPEGARCFYERVTYPDKQLIVYPGGYHELHNDVIFEQVLVDMAEWMEQRANSGSLKIESERAVRASMEDLALS
jgi:alpha-beta hydrolase superfamily lysophospholipase